MAKVRILGDMNLSGLHRGLQDLASESSKKGSWVFEESGFNGWMTETMDPSSRLRAGEFDVGVYILSPRLLSQSGLIDDLRNCLAVLKENTPFKTVFFGSFFADPMVAQPLIRWREMEARVQLLNQILSAQIESSRSFHVIDLQAFVSRKGLEGLCDLRYESLGRMYFSPPGQEELAQHIWRYLNCLQKPAAKVLVLDLDHTLWGGVLGEDGMDGIRLGGEGEGYLFRQFQSELLRMKENGILLAVASKNNEAEALAAIDGHPDMILRSRDFASIRINWNQKADSLKEISDELSLGLNSFVFLDDSSFERSQVSLVLPEVRVPEFSGPEDLLPLLRDLTAFDTLRITEEDKKRAGAYQIETERKAASRAFANLDEFYASLEMSLAIFSAKSDQIDRLHQLVLKTNQFNLTSRRYELAEFAARLTQEDYWVGGLRVADRFGESGVTGLFVVKKLPEIWEVENLLLSCRVIGRTVEFAVLQAMATQCFSSGARELRFHFVENERNEAAKKFLRSSGMSELNGVWTLTPLNLNQIPKHHVKVSWV